MNNIKLIIFDLDDTLINFGGVTEKAWKLTSDNLVKQFSLDIDSETIANEIVTINNAFWSDEEKRPKGNFSALDIRTSIVSNALNNLNICEKEIIDFLVNHYATYKYQAVSLYDDVPSVLKELKHRGYIIALLTNGDSSSQRERIARFNLEPLLDGIFIEGEQGVGKPDQKAYNNILKRFGVLEHEACMIGDHYLWEVVAPKQHGLKAIWVNRGNSIISVDDNYHADYIIANISELLDIFH